MKSKIHITVYLLACIFLSFVTTSLAAPTPGTIKAGTKITLKVLDRSELPGPIPSWIPRYRIGQKVTFQIGKKGELKIPSVGVSLRFLGGSRQQSSYYSGPDDWTVGDQRVFGGLYKHPLTKKSIITLKFLRVTSENGITNYENMEYVFR